MHQIQYAESRAVWNLRRNSARSFLLGYGLCGFIEKIHFKTKICCNIFLRIQYIRPRMVSTLFTIAFTYTKHEFLVFLRILLTTQCPFLALNDWIPTVLLLVISDSLLIQCTYLSHSTMFRICPYPHVCPYRNSIAKLWGVQRPMGHLDLHVHSVWFHPFSLYMCISRLHARHFFYMKQIRF